MEAAAQPEQLNQEGFDAFRQRTEEEGPVVMLNLLRFRPDGGQERYAEYGAAVAPSWRRSEAGSSSPGSRPRRCWEGAPGTSSRWSNTRAARRSWT